MASFSFTAPHEVREKGLQIKCLKLANSRRDTLMRRHVLGTIAREDKPLQDVYEVRDIKVSYWSLHNRGCRHTIKELFSETIGKNQSVYFFCTFSHPFFLGQQKLRALKKWRKRIFISSGSCLASDWWREGPTWPSRQRWERSDKKRENLAVKIVTTIEYSQIFVQIFSS